MSQHSYCATLLLVCTAIPVVARDDALKGASDGAVPAVEMVARLRDGTTVRKAVIEGGVKLITKYGTVTVPASDIRMIEFGLHLSEETAAEVKKSIANLTSDSYSERTAASKQLVALGHRAYPALQQAAQSRDKEVAARAVAALREIRAAVQEDLLRIGADDVVRTRDSVLRGRIAHPALRAKTSSLGTLELKLGDLRTLGLCDMDFLVDGPAGGSLRWQDTGIVVRNDEDLVIRALGQIDLQRDAPSFSAISGPSGCPQAASGQPHLPGTLLGKIGNTRDYFVVGQRFEARVVQGGTLYLSVFPLPGGKKTRGHYQVEVNMGTTSGSGAKRLEPFRLGEAQLEPKRLEGQKLAKEIMVWTAQMQSKGFDPQHKERYERGILMNVQRLEQLEREVRTLLGPALLPAHWLDEKAITPDPNPVPAFPGGALFR